MEKYKTCYTWKINKLYKEFHKYLSNVDGYSESCKICSTENYEWLLKSDAKKICSKFKIEKLCS